MIDRVQVLQYCDDPEIEPNELLARVVLQAGGAGKSASRPWGVLEGAEGQLTPVMARLGQEDLETVDTLITAGIAGNRAEAVRWALAQIRERPAYARLRERAREIEDLKAQF